MLAFGLLLGAVQANAAGRLALSERDVTHPGAHSELLRRWTNRLIFAAGSFNAGLLTLWAAITLTLLPRTPASPLAYLPMAVASIFGLAELTWFVNSLARRTQDRLPGARPAPQTSGTGASGNNAQAGAAGEVEPPSH